MKILVLGGGDSPEYEVSLKSSRAVYEAAIELGHQAEWLDPMDGDAAVREAAARNEIVLPILHGVNGEDGVIQRLLDETGVPYLGSGVAASELCFNKARVRELLAKNGILVARGEVVTSESLEQCELAKAPFVLKPVQDGSSVGVMLVRKLPFDRDNVLALLAKYGQMLIEELIVGTEITVPVLGKTALPVVEIVPPSGKEFDYENKYNGATSELCPPQHVSAQVQKRTQRIAEQVHSLTGARHLSRTDMMIDANERIYVLEINTMPGMTAQSLFPKSAAVAGMPWTKLVERFVELAKG